MNQRGSVLMLMPALVLVLLMLGAISVDSAIAYLGHRELQDFTASVADQAANAALDKPAFYGGGTVRIDEAAAQQVARAAWLARTGSGGLTISGVRVTFDPDDGRVTVTATGTVHEVFGVVFRHPEVTVQAASTASVVQVRVGG